MSLVALKMLLNYETPLPVIIESKAQRLTPIISTLGRLQEKHEFVAWAKKAPSKEEKVIYNNSNLLRYCDH